MDEESFALFDLFVTSTCKACKQQFAGVGESCGSCPICVVCTKMLTDVEKPWFFSCRHFLCATCFIKTSSDQIRTTTELVHCPRGGCTKTCGEDLVQQYVPAELFAIYNETTVKVAHQRELERKVQQVLRRREITPEDYALLLELDEYVKPKTLAVELVNSFSEFMIGDAAKPEPEQCHAGQSCLVCCSDYLTGEFVRVLPCGHGFHKHCIDMWLTKRSCKCPADNLEVMADEIVLA